MNKNLNKKLLFGLGGLAIVATPVFATISCSSTPVEDFSSAYTLKVFDRLRNLLNGNLNSRIDINSVSDETLSQSLIKDPTKIDPSYLYGFSVVDLSILKDSINKENGSFTIQFKLNNPGVLKTSWFQLELTGFKTNSALSEVDKKILAILNKQQIDTTDIFQYVEAKYLPSTPATPAIDSNLSTILASTDKKQLLDKLNAIDNINNVNVSLDDQTNIEVIDINVVGLNELIQNQNYMGLNLPYSSNQISFELKYKENGVEHVVQSSKMFINIMNIPTTLNVDDVKAMVDLGWFNNVNQIHKTAINNLNDENFKTLFNPTFTNWLDKNMTWVNQSNVVVEPTSVTPNVENNSANIKFKIKVGQADFVEYETEIFGFFVPLTVKPKENVLVSEFNDLMQLANGSVGLSKDVLLANSGMINPQWILDNKNKLLDGALDKLTDINQIENIKLEDIPNSKTSVKLTFILKAGSYYDTNASVSTENKQIEFIFNGLVFAYDISNKLESIYNEIKTIFKQYLFNNYTNETQLEIVNKIKTKVNEILALDGVKLVEGQKYDAISIEPKVGSGNKVIKIQLRFNTQINEFSFANPSKPFEKYITWYNDPSNNAFKNTIYIGASIDEGNIPDDYINWRQLPIESKNQVAISEFTDLVALKPQDAIGLNKDVVIGSNKINAQWILNNKDKLLTGTLDRLTSVDQITNVVLENDPTSNTNLKLRFTLKAGSYYDGNSDISTEDKQIEFTFSGLIFTYDITGKLDQIFDGIKAIYSKYSFSEYTSELQQTIVNEIKAKVNEILLPDGVQVIDNQSYEAIRLEPSVGGHKKAIKASIRFNQEIKQFNFSNPSKPSEKYIGWYNYPQSNAFNNGIFIGREVQDGDIPADYINWIETQTESKNQASISTFTDLMQLMPQGAIGLNKDTLINSGRITAQWILDNKDKLLSGTLDNINKVDEITNVSLVEDPESKTSLKLTFTLKAESYYNADGTLSTQERQFEFKFVDLIYTYDISNKLDQIFDAIKAIFAKQQFFKYTADVQTAIVNEIKAKVNEILLLDGVQLIEDQSYSAINVEPNVGSGNKVIRISLRFNQEIKEFNNPADPATTPAQKYISWYNDAASHAVKNSILIGKDVLEGSIPDDYINWYQLTNEEVSTFIKECFANVVTPKTFELGPNEAINLGSSTNDEQNQFNAIIAYLKNVKGLPKLLGEISTGSSNPRQFWNQDGWKSDSNEEDVKKYFSSYNVPSGQTLLQHVNNVLFENGFIKTNKSITKIYLYWTYEISNEAGFTKFNIKPYGWGLQWKDGEFDPSFTFANSGNPIRNSIDSTQNNFSLLVNSSNSGVVGEVVRK